MVTTPREALSAARERWNAGDLDGYLSLYHPRALLHGYTQEPMGKAEFGVFYEGLFRAFDTPRLVFHEELWDRDACSVRFTKKGRHVGEYLGVPPTDVDISIPGITILHFDGDRVVERYAQADMLGLLIRIGTVPVFG